MTLTVTDDQGATADNIAPVTVTAPPPPNQPPTAAFSSPVSNLVATFDSTASSDPDGTVVGRSWTFGDGGAATGTTPSTHMPLRAPIR